MPQQYGSVAAITVPSSVEIPTSYDFVLNRVVNQTFNESNPDDDALIQGGIYTTGEDAVSLDECPGAYDKYLAFFEYHPLNSGSGGYVGDCDPTALTLGSSASWAVYVGSDGWNVKMNGSYFLGTGEIGSQSDSSPDSSTSVAYGGGGVPWQCYGSSSQGSAFTISSSDDLDHVTPTSGWSYGTVPSPTISH